ncbi:MAG: hypothetical protein Q4B54_12430, partial [Coriobacteriales bacterium]|nr:hypothetical protein [Coriobacteriales bacterium]
MERYRRACWRVLIAFCAGALVALCGPAFSVAWASEDALSFQEAASRIEAELATLEPGEDYESGAVLVRVSPNADTANVKAELESSGIEGMQDVVAERVSDELVRVELAKGASVPG